MSNEESNPIMINIKTLKKVSILITDYPEFGYKSVDKFVNDAVIELLKLKSFEIPKHQTWRKR